MKDVERKTCIVCGNAEGNRVHQAREMMFGLRDPFDYLECDVCGCLRLLDPPAEPERYYPDGYYSYAASGPRRFDVVGRVAKRLRAAAYLGEEGWTTRLLGRTVLRVFGVTPMLRWLRRMAIGRGGRILDVGCGGGELLRELYRDGFRDLTGVDPFIERDLSPAAGLRILRARLDDLDSVFDLVMLHHSFEHMADPASVMSELRSRVRPGGWLLIRIPIADCEAWQEYGVDWVQLDAPRHVFLHTRRSLALLAGAAGFNVVYSHCDSTAFQFWGSELYRRDVPLRAPDAAGRIGAERFDRKTLQNWNLRADRLNALDQGDQAVFLMRRDDRA